MMKTLLFALTLISSAAFAETLDFSDGLMKVETSWLQGPRSPAVSEMQIEWINGGDGTRIRPPGTVSVRLWMPSMNHGSSPVTITELPETGVYKISDMYFTMGGDWTVDVTLIHHDGRRETRSLPVTVKGGGHRH